MQGYFVVVGCSNNPFPLSSGAARTPALRHLILYVHPCNPPSPGRSYKMGPQEHTKAYFNHIKPAGWLVHHSTRGHGLTFVLQSGAAAGDEDYDAKEPCFYCESPQHASSDCPKRRQNGAEGWMHKARRAFENRQELRGERASGGEGGNALSNHVREAAGN